MKKLLWIVSLFLLVSCVVFTQAAQITATWNDNSDNETGFAIEKSVDGGQFVEIGRVEKDVIKFVDTGPFTGGVTYTYRLRAFNVAGYSGYSNTATIVWPSIPNAPTAVILKIE